MLRQGNFAAVCRAIRVRFVAMHLIHSFLFIVRISDEVDVHHKTVLDLNGSKNIVAFHWNYGGYMYTNCA